MDRVKWCTYLKFGHVDRKTQKATTAGNAPFSVVGHIIFSTSIAAVNVLLHISTTVKGAIARFHVLTGSKVMLIAASRV